MSDLIPLLPTDPEPPHGSILIIESTSGTAVQRFYSDGLYHSTTGRVVTYADLFRRPGRRPRPVYLVYIPPKD